MTEQSLPLEMILFTSARASAHFALRCLEPIGEHLRACSSFVTPQREIMHWHDFGDLEGPGWAANAVGGAHLLYRWGRYLGDPEIQSQALALLDHVLEDGFIDAETGFLWPYYDLAAGRFCANYVHRDDWLCPGSLARVGVQLLEFADDLAGQEVGEPWLAQGEQAGVGGVAHPSLLQGLDPRATDGTGRRQVWLADAQGKDVLHAGQKVKEMHQARGRDGPQALGDAGWGH